MWSTVSLIFIACSVTGVPDVLLRPHTNLFILYMHVLALRTRTFFYIIHIIFTSHMSVTADMMFLWVLTMYKFVTLEAPHSWLCPFPCTGYTFQPAVFWSLSLLWGGGGSAIWLKFLGIPVKCRALTNISSAPEGFGNKTAQTF
jgi:hypothetical protein